jgi:hypothetical protein
MADYISQGAFEPSIPKHLITEEDLKVLNAFGLTITPDGEDKMSLFADDWCTAGYVENDDGEESELTEDDLYTCLQGIIRRSNGELPWISKETAYTCTRNLSDGFGGSAAFVTADDVQFFGTSSWLEQRIHEAETGDIGPETDDSYLPLLREVFQVLTTDGAGSTPDLELMERCAADTSDSAKLSRIAWKIHRAIGAAAEPSKTPTMCIVLDGGAVQEVVTDSPEQFHASMDIVVIDTDVEGFDEMNLLKVPHNGEIEHAVGHLAKLMKSDYDLTAVVDQIKKRGW